jgi:protease I
MKALIITWENFQDHEVIYPYYRLDEEGFNVEIMANVTGRIYGILGTNMESSRTTEELNNPKKYREILDDYDFLVIPGGVKALEKLRQEEQVLRFVNEWNQRGKVIASTCHGAQLLISSGVVRGREISGYYSIKDDINNAGATYVDAPAVRSENIISSPHYKHMGPWMKTSIEVFNTSPDGYRGK